MKISWVGFLAVVLTTTASAQLDEIVVTAAMRSGYDEMPAVTVTKNADFLVQNIRLVNDSRSPDLRKTDESLQLIEDRQRIDTSYVDIYAKIALDPDRGTKNQISDLREFVAGVRKAGRTEILPLGDIGLSVIGPEQYRYEIIKKIAEENAKISESLAAECSIAIGGLEGRVQWERTSVSELTLYIPYGLEISDCTG